MNVLVDSNVVLDILLQNEGLYIGSTAVFAYAEQNLIDGYISASAVTDIFYITKKRHGKEIALKSIKKILQVIKPATVTGDNIFKALDLDWNDFEDAVQYVVGESLTLDRIITRNISDFSKGKIPAVTPEQFIDIITDD